MPGPGTPNPGKGTPTPLSNMPRLESFLKNHFCKNTPTPRPDNPASEIKHGLRSKFFPKRGGQEIRSRDGGIRWCRDFHNLGVLPGWCSRDGALSKIFMGGI